MGQASCCTRRRLGRVTFPARRPEHDWTDARVASVAESTPLQQRRPEAVILRGQRQGVEPEIGRGVFAGGVNEERHSVAVSDLSSAWATSRAAGRVVKMSRWPGATGDDSWSCLPWPDRPTPRDMLQYIRRGRRQWQRTAVPTNHGGVQPAGE